VKEKKEWVVKVTHTLAKEWMWTLCPAFIGGKPIEGSRAFNSKAKAVADARKLARNVRLKLKHNVV
jgi:hypothetical protein